MSAQIEIEEAKLGRSVEFVGIYKNPEKDAKIPLKLSSAITLGLPPESRVWDLFSAIAYSKFMIRNLVKSIPSYQYNEPGTYLQDKAFMNWLKGKRDSGELKTVGLGGIFFPPSTDGAPRGSTLADIPQYVDLLLRSLSAFEQISSWEIGTGEAKYDAVKLYNASNESISDITELAELLYYAAYQDLWIKSARWAKVPIDSVFAGLLAETKKDSFLHVFMEWKPMNTVAGDAFLKTIDKAKSAVGTGLDYQRVNGSGIANLHWSLPDEATTGIYISRIFQYPGVPFATLEQEWETQRSRKDRDAFVALQNDVRKSVALYCAEWRSVAENFVLQRPARFSQVLLANVGISNWSDTHQISAGELEMSFANFIMAAIEQASMGFDVNGRPIVNKIDLRDAVFLQNDLQLRDNLLFLNKSRDPNEANYPYSFVTESYDDQTEVVKIYREILNKCRK